MKQVMESVLLTTHTTYIKYHIRSVLLFISLFLWSVGVSEGQWFDFVTNSTTDYCIVVADSASPSTLHGAQELQRFLREIFNADFPIVSDTEQMRPYEILLGDNRHLRRIDVRYNLEELGDEGYILKTAGPHLIIAGGELRGSLYGVYGFLEDHLGCRWYTTDVSAIPSLNHFKLPILDECFIPSFEYREPYVWEAFNGDWAARNRMNRNSKDGGLESRHGGKVEWVPSMFVHTFIKLVPPEKYYSAHPEYFSLVGGKRLKKKPQLCCTNEDVIKLVTEEVLKAFRENPNAQLISVSQNDWNNYCECPSCQSIAEREGSQIAPVLFLVNRVAETVEKEFPGKMVETLAYQWSRDPPKSLRPRRNVIIRLCTVECCFTHPVSESTCEANRAFAADLMEWSKAAEHLWVWNYCTSFAHYFIPFPDLRARDDTMRFFTENNVKGVFQQDVYSTPCGELSSLSAYLNAKLLWNPRADGDSIIHDFLAGVYGPAAGVIKQYLDLIHDTAEQDTIHIGIWQGPDAGYLTDSVLDRADSLWCEAEKAAEHYSDILERVKTARLSVDYAILERDRLRGDALIPDHESFRLEVNPLFTQRLDRFCAVASNAGVKQLKEYSLSIGEYREEIEKTIYPKSLSPMEPAEHPACKQGLVFRYYEGSWKEIPKLETLTPKKEGFTEQFTLPFKGHGDAYNFIFSGFISVPNDGIYTFFTKSDGYSAISIGRKEIIKNNGNDSIRERNGHIALKKGFHHIIVTFATKENGNHLEVFYKGPDIEKNVITNANIMYYKK